VANSPKQSLWAERKPRDHPELPIFSKRVQQGSFACSPFLLPSFPPSLSYPSLSLCVCGGLRARVHYVLVQLQLTQRAEQTTLASPQGWCLLAHAIPSLPSCLPSSLSLPSFLPLHSLFPSLSHSFSTLKWDTLSLRAMEYNGNPRDLYRQADGWSVSTLPWLSGSLRSL